MNEGGVEEEKGRQRGGEEKRGEEENRETMEEGKGGGREKREQTGRQEGKFFLESILSSFLKDLLKAYLPKLFPLQCIFPDIGVIVLKDFFSGKQQQHGFIECYHVLNLTEKMTCKDSKKLHIKFS